MHIKLLLRLIRDNMISKKFNGQWIYVPCIVHVNSIGSLGGCVQALLDCLMYKLSYYRYAEAATMTTGQYGFDRVRNVVIGRPDIELEYFEEVSLLLDRPSTHALDPANYHHLGGCTLDHTQSRIVFTDQLHIVTFSNMMSWMHVVNLHLHHIR